MDHHMTAPARAIISRADDLSWSIFADERIAVRISSLETGGAYAMVEGILGPMSGPPVHIHQREDEVIEVLEGRLMFTLDNHTFEAAASDVIVVPRGTPHT